MLQGGIFCNPSRRQASLPDCLTVTLHLYPLYIVTQGLTGGYLPTFSVQSSLILFFQQISAVLCPCHGGQVSRS